MSNSSNHFETDCYTDLRGERHPLTPLDDEERAFIKRCREAAQGTSDWAIYHNFWMAEIARLYAPRGLSRKEITKTLAWRIAQDIGSRLGIASGMMAPGDYRAEIEDLILSRFKTRRAFCEATGISEDMLSHVLARRKHLAIDTLEEALGKIGYTLRIVPSPTLSNS